MDIPELVSHLDETGPVSATTSQKRKTDSCVICLEDITERAITVPCNHYSFDFICLASWVQNNPTCPLCKTELSALQYDWRDIDDYKTYRVPRERHPDPSPQWTGRHDSQGRRQHSSCPRGQRFLHASRPRPRRRDPFARPVVEADEALSRRRRVYRNQLYSYHIGTNRVSRYQDISPAAISRSAQLQSRAKMWIRRELQVFDFLGPDSGATSRQASNREFLLEYIMAVLRTVDIKESSGRAQEKLADFLGEENSSLFLHELGAWLRSPFERLQDWDRIVQYEQSLERPSECEIGQ